MLKSIDTGSVLSTQTSAAGAYRFSLLQPGIHLVTATAPGFKAAEKRVQIGLGSSVTMDVQLIVGTASVTVEVSAAEANVATEDANLNTNYDAKQPGNPAQSRERSLGRSLHRACWAPFLAAGPVT